MPDNSAGMFRSVCLCLALLVPATAVAQYRPLSLGDIVDAVGSNPEGMPTDELGERITTYAYFTSDDQGVGLAVRFASDPEGAIFVGWRFKNELWRWGWIEDEALGRLEVIRPAGSGFFIDTRHPDGTGTAVVLRPDLTVLTTAAGIARLALPSGVLLLERATSLELLDPASRKVATLFVRPDATPTVAFGAFKHDPKTDTLSFDLRNGSNLTTVRCSGVSGSQRKCG
jgi:hypothetical protein